MSKIVANLSKQGLVTAAMKLNRKALNEKYKSDIEAAYKKAGN